MTIRLVLLAALGLAAHTADLPSSRAAMTIDGKLDDALWHSSAVHALAPEETGVPADLGGDVRVALRGSWLCLAARLPEPGGKVLARSFGRNPEWDRDLVGSPEVEDRLVFTLRYSGASGAARSVSIALNPWGAYRIEENGEIISSLEVLRAAQVTSSGWNVEAAIPLDRLEVGAREMRIRTERIRSRRPLAPEFRWSWPASAEGAPYTLAPASGTLPPPEVRAPALGNTEPPLEIGRVLKAPPVIASWDHPAWEAVPSFELPRNEPYPRAPRHSTKVKWVHDGQTLALLFRLDEPEPVVARAGGRDSNVTGDDHVAVYLATNGSRFLEVAVNTVGAIADARGGGPLRQRPQTGWNARIETQTDIRHGHWIARVNIPLADCAAALGESGIPREWRVLVARLRAARPGDAAEQSALPPVGGASTFYGPIRYRRMVLSDSDPMRVAKAEPARPAAPKPGLAGELAALDPNVWSDSERRHRGVRNMVGRYLEKRIEQAVLAERRAWEGVRTRADWEKFRDTRIQALRQSAGVFPPERPALDSRVTARHEGDGYRLENVIFQSRKGYWMPANLYLPKRAAGKVPGMIIVHSQHYPKTQGELHDMGELWARSGAAVLVIERPGYGERVETTPWFRQAYGSRNLFTKQLFVAGESYSGWAAWDIIRSVDYLFERQEIDTGKILVLGSVAGGGEPAAVAAALDTRIAAVVPFNYDQGHVRVHGDSPGQIAHQFSPWLVAASVAPRRFVRAFEFGWEGAEEPDYPNLWFDGLRRSEKVWDFYNARENLATSQAYGLIRLSMERVSHCFSIGPQQRAELYPVFQRWFGIALPSAKDLAILPDSLLGVNPVRDEARRQEALRRRPHADLLSIPPAVNAAIERRRMHMIAREIGESHLRAAREKSSSLNASARAERLRSDLKPMLGDIEPAAAPVARQHWRRSLSGTSAEAASVAVEDGIDVPLLLLLPPAAKNAPVVVAVSQGGKERFLANRAADLEAMLQSGIAVCLVDVRGTGETSPSHAAGENSALAGLAHREFDLARNLLGSRLKDLRTVLVYLRTRPELDSRRIGVWGESFAPANESPLFLDEIETESGPQIQYRADPSGAHLALLAGLYEAEVQAVAARGGLVSYLSVLDDAFSYVPTEAIVHGVVKAGDIADIAAALAPRALILSSMVSGRNIEADAASIKTALAVTERAYGDTGSARRLTVAPRRGGIGDWLVSALKAAAPVRAGVRRRGARDRSQESGVRSQDCNRRAVS